MAWKKVPQEHVDAFTEALPRAEGVEQKKMFGCPAGFVNGNLFCGAHELNVNVRLGPAEREKALKKPGFGTFTVRGRTMGEYVTLPPDKVKTTVFGPSALTSVMLAMMPLAADLESSPR